MAEFVPIREAVTRLGVSETAIRRRLRAGTLHGQRKKTPQGHVWLIEVPDQPPPSRAPAAAQAAPSHPDPALERELAEVRQEVAVAKEALARLEAHNADLRATNQRLGEELAARRVEVERLIVIVREAQRQLAPPPLDPIDAGAGPPNRPPERDQPDAQAAPSRPEGDPPWWRRAWRRLAGDPVIA